MLNKLKIYKTYDYATKNWHNFIVNRTLAFIGDLALAIFSIVFIYICMIIFN